MSLLVKFFKWWIPEGWDDDDCEEPEEPLNEAGLQKWLKKINAEKEQ